MRDPMVGIPAGEWAVCMRAFLRKHNLPHDNDAVIAAIMESSGNNLFMSEELAFMIKMLNEARTSR